MMAYCRKVIIFMFAAMLCASQGYPETAPIIKVDVNFKVSAITNAWNYSTRNQVIKDSREAIARELRTTYRYWDFRADDQEGAVTIELQIIDPYPSDNIIQANLELNVIANKKKRKSWDKEWLKPTDFQYRLFPTNDSMAEQLAGKFREYFIDNRTDSLGEWLLRSIPVGRTGAWMKDSDDYLIVLSMPKEKYGYLSMSVFRIMENPPSAAAEELEAFGQGGFAPYPVPNNSSPFNGLIVKVVKRESIQGEGKDLGPEVRNVKALGPIYLKEEKQFEPLDVFFSQEDVQ